MKESLHFKLSIRHCLLKFTVEWIDPVLHPSALTENDASENSIVVSCQDTGKKK